MSKKVIKTINPKDGTVTYEVDGVMGSSCKDITELLTANAVVLSDTEKEEFLHREEVPAYTEDL